ncbi:NADP-dependent oxidoreductase [Kribbella sandramycini]|uniref:NADP-dependent oxidoreductase n=1 Tax=Kribbella sandramycini TaxID=60450 RepID=A0A7Y4L703_9ACTN|nr:NADP-dependent oxidoreductase [Kribbella sandramycini]MBB6566786.1 NADPH:quinone reductase-like Zn-dependent oxidoreductase [Kribbella sandramycini]NOL45570.1 NADP-dependent oxidoreductase [Kribbella sandramycini]
MRAVVVGDREAGVDGLTVGERPYPHAAENDVVVRVHAAGFTRGELDWPGTWTDRAGRDRAPSIPGHEVAGVVAELGYGTTGLTVGQRVFGLTDWTRDGTLAEYVAVEARNLAPLPASIDYVTAAALPISGLTAWQGLFDHGRLQPGQSVLIHGAGGAVGSVAVQLAREVGAHIIGTGRAADRSRAAELGVHQFIDLENEDLDDEVDVIFDVIGGAVRDQSLQFLRSGGTLVTIADPPTVHSQSGRDIFFVVEPNRPQLTELATRLQSGRLTPLITTVADLAEAPAAFATRGRTIITIAPTNG